MKKYTQNLPKRNGLAGYSRPLAASMVAALFVDHRIRYSTAPPLTAFAREGRRHG